jgi:integrase
MSRCQSVPTYRLHKQSGQAVVTLTDGLGTRRDVLLGKYDTGQSRAEYARVIGEWEASGRRLPAAASEGLSVNELLLAYWQFAESYYRKNGEPTTQLERIRQALRPVRKLYGHTPAAAFGPKALKAVRERMLQLPCGHCQGTGKLRPPSRRSQRRSGNCGIECRRCGGSGVRGWARGLVNSAIGCVKRAFKWGVAEEIIPASVYHGLQAVDGLRAGRSEARETRKVRPVADADVDAVLPFLTPPVRAMVELERLTGCRPGEIVILRPCNVERRQPTWVYRPSSHKTEHHGTVRTVFLGPRAQAVLAPFLLRDPGHYCFLPREALADLRARQRAARRTPVQPSQADRRKRRPRKAPGECYTVGTYRNAVERACSRAGIAPWHVNQLRHTTATEIRREHGLDAARAVLGHRTPAVTEVYAEVDQAKAAEVMGRIG